MRIIYTSPGYNTYFPPSGLSKPVQDIIPTPPPIRIIYKSPGYNYMVIGKLQSYS